MPNPEGGHGYYQYGGNGSGYQGSEYYGSSYYGTGYAWYGQGGAKTGRSPIVGVSRSSETIDYTMTPLAAAQWAAAMDWADEQGRIEIALHAIGRTHERHVERFECGKQWVSSASCRNDPQELVEIGRRAAEGGLCLLGQCHHHPFYGSKRRRDDDEAVQFFLSGTDWELLDQLSSELASATMSCRRELDRSESEISLETTETTRLATDGRAFTLPLPPGTAVRLQNVRLERLVAHSEGFVAVSGSDRHLPHGYVLRSQMCVDCGQAARRRLHPLSFDLTDETEFDFDEEAWTERLTKNVLRGWGPYQYSKWHGKKVILVDDEEDEDNGRHGKSKQSGLSLRARQEIAERIEVLENLVTADSPEAAVVAELRSLIERRGPLR